MTDRPLTKEDIKTMRSGSFSVEPLLHAVVQTERVASAARCAKTRLQAIFSRYGISNKLFSAVLGEHQTAALKVIDEVFGAALQDKEEKK